MCDAEEGDLLTVGVAGGKNGAPPERNFLVFAVNHRVLRVASPL